MKFKQIFFAAFTLSMCVVCSSCMRLNNGYTSGKYVYSYYLVNDLQDTVVMHQQYSSSDETTVLVPGDTLCFSMMGYEFYADELEELKRPTIEYGYGFVINAFPTTLTVNGTTYDIDKDQELSFMNCANYKGVPDAKRDFFYNYYFHINGDYIASLQGKITQV